VSRPDAPGSARGGGPRTRQGRNRARWNATKHGLTARGVVPGEDADERDSFLCSIVQSLDPLGPLESELAGQIAAELWRLRRFERVEAELVHDATLCREAEEAHRVAGQYSLEDPIAEILERLNRSAEPLTPEAEAARDAALAHAADVERIATSEAALARAFTYCAPGLQLTERYRTTAQRGIVRLLTMLHALQDRRLGRGFG
jgi:hypothetical protein